MARRPTQADVARLAGASTAVVSAVVNDRHDAIRCSPQTRERILAAVRQLGYAPNPVARRLAHGRSDLIGVFTHQPLFPVGAGSFYHPFLVGVEEQAAEQGVDLVLFTGRRGGPRRIYRDGMNGLLPTDGAVLFGAAEDREELARLVDEGFPFVYIGRRDVPGVSYVAADYVHASAEVVAAMIGYGHRRISYLRSPGDHEVVADRDLGVRRAHETAGIALEEDLIVTVTDAAAAGSAFLHWYERGVRAVVTENRAHCAAVLQAAAERGLRCPAEFSLAVLDDDPTPGTAAVTGFTIPKRDMGVAAVRELTELLGAPENAPARRLTLPCTFAAGTTVTAPR